MNVANSSIKSIVPWKDRVNEFENTIDLLTSQDSMEHVENIVDTYGAMWKILKPNGMIIHQIDFSSHVGGEWNSHWEYSELMWKWLVWGKRRYPMNRHPISVHIAAMEKAGFEIVLNRKEHDNINNHRRLYHDYSKLSEDDLTTRSAIVAAIKK